MARQEENTEFIKQFANWIRTGLALFLALLFTKGVWLYGTQTPLPPFQQFLYMTLCFTVDFILIRRFVYQARLLDFLVGNRR